MWHKAEWMGHPMRLELTRVGLLVYLANRYTTIGARCSFQVSEFEIQSCYNFHFRTNIFGKCINLLISSKLWVK